MDYFPTMFYCGGAAAGTSERKAALHTQDYYQFCFFWFYTLSDAQTTCGTEASLTDFASLSEKNGVFFPTFPWHARFLKKCNIQWVFIHLSYYRFPRFKPLHIYFLSIQNLHASRIHIKRRTSVNIHELY